ncbi:MAG: MarR family EPS-associated transcriptional regulator [Sulfurimonas sp.]|nr:MarR family EPS-associated transcriptional regulator [Sulfurimonas sp.]MDD5202737.1 MarR family EPS-associated transcriptional regulator [Sulfurimonas sp.]
MQNEELTLTLLRNVETLKGQKSLADELGMSVGKVNYVLKALVEKGFVKIDNFFANKNKNQYRYLLTPEGLNEKITLTEKFIKRKKAEYNELTHELEEMKMKGYQI